MTTNAKDWIRQEWHALGLKPSLQPALILLSASVLLTVWRCYGSAAFFERHIAGAFRPGELVPLWATLYTFASCLLCMFVVPAALVRFVLKKRLRDFGLSLGDARAGLVAVGVLLPVIALALLLPASGQADFRGEYPLFHGAGRTLGLFVAYELLYAVYYLGWEFFFRGWMLFGLRDAVGAVNAILIQTIPSTLLHIGKPDGEILAAIVAGVVFGVIALRTRSIFYVFLLHWLIGVTLDVFIVLGAG